MKFIFWQNIISIHQSELFNKLILDQKVEELVLIVDEKINQARKNDGWALPILNSQIKLVVNPDFTIINNYLKKYSTKDCIHIFSGISAYPLVISALNLIKEKDFKVGIMAEPSNWIGIRGIFNIIKGYKDKFFYGTKIDFILCIGHRGKWWYEDILKYNSSKIFEFAYFSKPNENQNLKVSNSVKIVYLGRLIPVKGVDNLIFAFQNLKIANIELHIYGEGTELTYLKSLIKNNFNNIFFHGQLNSKDVYSSIADKDILVLPSVGKDGWGAVVNEGLLNGLKVLTSSFCGSSELVGIKILKSYQFNPELKNDIFFKLSLMIEETLKDENRMSTKLKIVQWANSNLSGQCGAIHLVNIIEYLDGKSFDKPKLGWLNNS